MEYWHVFCIALQLQCSVLQYNIILIYRKRSTSCMKEKYLHYSRLRKKTWETQSYKNGWGETDCIVLLLQGQYTWYREQKIPFKLFISLLSTSYFCPVLVAENPLMMQLFLIDGEKSFTVSIYLNWTLVQGRVQKEMSFFDGIFLYCLWMTITLPSEIKQEAWNYIILIICSYQWSPGLVLPAYIVLHACCSNHFLSVKVKKQNVHWRSKRVHPNRKQLGLIP